jgi:hypothetical protein
MGKTEIIYPEVSNEIRMPTLPTPIQHSPGIPSQSNKTRRRNKMNTNRKVVKLFLFTDDMILYRKFPPQNS